VQGRVTTAVDAAVRRSICTGERTLLVQIGEKAVDRLKPHQGSKAHKVHKYKEYHSVCPLVGIGTLPTPLSPASVPPPPRTKGEEAHSSAGEGLGESRYRRLEKNLALCLVPTLWWSLSRRLVPAAQGSHKKCRPLLLQCRFPSVKEVIDGGGGPQ
jgi:hypothetical protein